MTYEDKNYVAAATQQTLAIGINRWLLRNRFDDGEGHRMSIADIRACNKEMRDAARERAKIIRDMNLNAPPVDPWVTLDASNGKPTDDQ
jgi:hypothetical protein